MIFVISFITKINGYAPRCIFAEIMVRPIKDTPTLTGKDAKAFADQLKKVDELRPSAAELSKMVENFKKIESITKNNHAVSPNLIS